MLNGLSPFRQGMDAIGHDADRQQEPTPMPRGLPELGQQGNVLIVD
jgi:hypothetical protein